MSHFKDNELFSKISNTDSAAVNGGQNSSNPIGIVAITAGVLLFIYGVGSLTSDMRKSSDISL